MDRTALNDALTALKNSAGMFNTAAMDAFVAAAIAYFDALEASIAASPAIIARLAAVEAFVGEKTA